MTASYGQNGINIGNNGLNVTSSRALATSGCCARGGSKIGKDGRSERARGDRPGRGALRSILHRQRGVAHVLPSLHVLES